MDLQGTERSEELVSARRIQLTSQVPMSARALISANALSAGSARGSALGLMDAKDVALGVLEPRGLVGSDHSDVLHRLETGQIVVLEHHAALLQLLYFLHHVLHLEAQRRVLGLRTLGLGDERDGGSPRAREHEIAVGREAQRLQAQRFLVEARARFMSFTGRRVVVCMGYPLSSTVSREHVALDARAREAHAEVALRRERFSVPDARSKGRWAISGLDFARGWWWS